MVFLTEAPCSIDSFSRTHVSAYIHDFVPGFCSGFCPRFFCPFAIACSMQPNNGHYTGGTDTMQGGGHYFLVIELLHYPLNFALSFEFLTQSFTFDPKKFAP